jgi:pimeloyl-ACP methyl ester carboxylesterase
LEILMRHFARTLFLHGYAGSPNGTVRKLHDALLAVGVGDALGVCEFPQLPFALESGATFEDSPEDRLMRLSEALKCVDWDHETTLIIGTSMGGLLGALLAQHHGQGTCVALSSPDHVGPLGLLPPSFGGMELVTAYSSQDDTVIHGRTSRWASLTPYCFDVPGLTHNHAAVMGTLVFVTSGFLRGLTPEQIQAGLEEARDFPIPF